MGRDWNRHKPRCHTMRRLEVTRPTGGMTNRAGEHIGMKTGRLAHIGDRIGIVGANARE